MYTFRKTERLCNFRLRSLLFNKGKRFYHYPFSLVYLCLGVDELSELFHGSDTNAKGKSFRYPVKCLVSVSKRLHKKAVHRNRIKRLVKEAYRKNKNIIYTFLEEKEYVCLVALFYNARDIYPYHKMEAAMEECLNRFREVLAKPGEDKAGM